MGEGGEVCVLPGTLLESCKIEVWPREQELSQILCLGCVEVCPNIPTSRLELFVVEPGTKKRCMWMEERERRDKENAEQCNHTEYIQPNSAKERHCQCQATNEEISIVAQLLEQA